jgi:hypothetical protein
MGCRTWSTLPIEERTRTSLQGMNYKITKPCIARVRSSVQFSWRLLSCSGHIILCFVLLLNLILKFSCLPPMHNPSTSFYKMGNYFLLQKNTFILAISCATRLNEENEAQFPALRRTVLSKLISV